MNVAILKYNAGNVFSVECALKRIGIEAKITDNINEIINADKVIFPGVGEASSAMDYLHAKNLDKLIIGLRQPVLGICIGLQLMCKHSEEGDTNCLGIFNTNVKKFDSNLSSPEMKIPHTGWDTISEIKTNGFLSNEFNSKYVYYVHSYYAALCDETIATTEYITKFSAALQKDNFYATQFHPEKSGSIGEAILKQFIEL
ncbi:MAG: imidazole glycerol phosphate synthase subunit HisH [Muribaculaceae bacterium]